MEQKVQLKYIHKQLQIGMVSWREVYLLYPLTEQFMVEVYKGNIVYRRKGSSKRIYYKSLKKGLVNTNHVITLILPDWF